MLGRELLDPQGVEGAAQGLGILPIVTEFQREKRYRRGTYTFGQLRGFWAPLTGLAYEGYEIRHGATRTLAREGGPLGLEPALPDDCGWQHGQVLALYTHGVFEEGAVLRALFGAEVPTLEDTFEGLAEFVERYLGAAPLMGLLA